MLRRAIGTILLAGVLACAGIAAAQSDSKVRLLDLADDYRAGGRYLEALSFYRDVDMNGWAADERVRLYAGLADLLDGYLGDRAGARRMYEQMLELSGPDTDVAGVLHRLARACFRSGDRAAAVSAYQRLVAGYPDYSRDRQIAHELEGLAARGLPPEDIALVASRPLPRTVRVLVAQTADPVTVSGNRGMRVLSRAADMPATLAAGRQMRLRAHGGGIAADDQDVRVQEPLRLEPLENGVLQVQERRLRGAVEVISEAGRLMVVNHVPIEDYLYGVLPREMSPSWPEHALKAQAVAARTYALYHMIKRAGEPCDVFSTTSSQVYGGQQDEHPAVNRAVDATRGSILVCDDRVVLTLYHANSGGVTGAVEDIWGSPVGCIHGVTDTFSLNTPGAVWEYTMSAGDIVERLGEYGIVLADIIDITARDRVAGRRIARLEIRHPGGSLFLSGNSFRLMVGPGRVKSADFEVRRRGDAFVFNGRGYGHGAGMSQWGARSMARAGRDYRSILAWYYPGARILDMQAP